jgi:hypothetical protein
MTLNSEIFIKLIQDKTHAVHQTTHISTPTLRLIRLVLGHKSLLETFKILHPFQCEIVRLGVHLIEYQDEWKSSLV